MELTKNSVFSAALCASEFSAFPFSGLGFHWLRNCTSKLKENTDDHISHQFPLRLKILLRYFSLKSETQRTQRRRGPQRVSHVFIARGGCAVRGCLLDAAVELTSNRRRSSEWCIPSSRIDLRWQHADRTATAVARTASGNVANVVSSRIDDVSAPCWSRHTGIGPVRPGAVARRTASSRESTQGLVSPLPGQSHRQVQDRAR